MSRRRTDTFWRRSGALQWLPKQANVLHALTTRLGTLVEQFVKLAQDTSPEQLQAALRTSDLSQMADSLAHVLKLSVEDKQGLLEIYPTHERLLRLAELLEIEIDKLNVDRTIQTRVKRQMERAQREYYLNEKIKAIHKELGRKDDVAEIEELKQKIESAGMSPRGVRKGDERASPARTDASNVSRVDRLAPLP